jgi:hypothetical protein
MISPLRILFLLAFISCLTAAKAQTNTDSTRLITVEGIAQDPGESYASLFLMVVNQRTGQGNFGDPYGRFSIQVQHRDTILVSARGYHIAKVCVADSAYKPLFDVTVNMKELQVTLAEVQVYPDRPIEEIEEDIDELGKELAEMQPIDGFEAFQSPITALYQRFSKIEQSKRKVAEMENEDRKRELLKELFRKYIQYDIIDLSVEKFDDFISFMDLPDSFIRSAPAYDLIMEIKRRFEIYEEVNIGW